MTQSPSGGGTLVSCRGVRRPHQQRRSSQHAPFDSRLHPGRLTSGNTKMTPQNARSELVAVAKEYLAGISQAGQENIHPEWKRLLAGIATHAVNDDLDTFKRWSTTGSISGFIARIATVSCSRACGRSASLDRGISSRPCRSSTVCRKSSGYVFLRR